MHVAVFAWWIALPGNVPMPRQPCEQECASIDVERGMVHDAYCASALPGRQWHTVLDGRNHRIVST